MQFQEHQAQLLRLFQLAHQDMRQLYPDMGPDCLPSSLARTETATTLPNAPKTALSVAGSLAQL
jgi:hypothetical protein